MALRQYEPDQYEYHSPKEQQATYQAYQAKNQSTERLKEVLFFLNIVIFSIFTVVSTYIYLFWNVPAFFAFILGGLTGLGALKLIQFTSKRYFNYLRHKRNSR